jgi:hypothetical protein
MTVICRSVPVDERACVACLNCEARFILGAAAIAVRCAGELLGYVCRRCLADDAQAQFDAVDRRLRQLGGLR